MPSVALFVVDAEFSVVNKEISTIPDVELCVVDEEPPDEHPPFDLFNLYSPASKRWILIAAALVASITPFTDTIYLPALNDVSVDLRGSASDVASTVSIYLAAASIGQLAFGPASDLFGRIPTLYLSLILYEGITIGCIFAKSMDQLILLRAFEGLAVAGTIVPVQAVIADIFPPHERGAASGAFFVPILIGPIVAPILGGFLSLAFGWRATFVLLAAMTIIIAAFSVFILPETHPWYARLKHQNGHAALVEDKAANDINVLTAPAIVTPWAAVLFLFDQELSPYYLSVGTTFAGMFTTLTMLPIYLSQPPYSLTSDIIGLTYIPIGISMLLGSIIGGSAADASAKAFNKCPDGRMTYLLCALWIVPPGLIGFGFALENGAHLAGVLVAHSVLGFGQAALMPSTLSYLSSIRSDCAGTVGSVLMFLCFASSALAISVSVIISDATSIGYFFLLAAAIVAIGAIITSWINIKRTFYDHLATN